MPWDFGGLDCAARVDAPIGTLEKLLSIGVIIQIDHTEYDGFRARLRYWNGDFGGFYSGDTIADALAALLEARLEKASENEPK